MTLLLPYKNKRSISTSVLNQRISNEKYKISTDTTYSKSSSSEYLLNELKYLGEFKPNINIEDDYGRTLLFHACINENEMNGNTALVYECELKNETIVKYLVEHGADVDKENKDGDNPLYISFSNKNEQIINISKENKDSETPLFKIYINKEERYGETLLFEVYFNRKENIVRYIVEHRTDINMEVRYGETPLFNTCFYRNENIVLNINIKINKNKK
ncbi:hypothetical protein PIROE2DRAFT_12667 [Piromyces sp. E2]|nr:hypothetical protein PIROE2DRAFT_12667 [Piromyces sp. E2]|eukprot:OUM61331.1 hypothetical protein PIROE2DRAFT_12667 [Piromyces sp. E2]